MFLDNRKESSETINNTKDLSRLFINSNGDGNYNSEDNDEDSCKDDHVYKPVDDNLCKEKERKAKQVNLMNQKRKRCSQLFSNKSFDMCNPKNFWYIDENEDIA